MRPDKRTSSNDSPQTKKRRRIQVPDSNENVESEVRASQDENPETILGLDHIEVEIPQGDDIKDESSFLEAKATSSISDISQNLEQSSVEEDFFTDDNDSQSDDQDTEEEEADQGKEEFFPVATLRPDQAELMERLISNNESLTFSELTAMMGDAISADPELCPAPIEEDNTDTPVEAPEDVRVESSVSIGEQCEGIKSTASRFDKTLSEQQRYNFPDASSMFGRLIDNYFSDAHNLQFRRGRSSRGRGTRLHPTLKALMGQAHLCMSQNNTEEAIKMCLEIIRQFPNSPTPYETLAIIYEDRGMQDKSLQFQLMAAFLSPMPDKWVDLAEHYTQQEELEQAVYCYSRAIKQSPWTLSYHWSRAVLLESMGNPGRALKCYTYMLKFLKPNQAKPGLQLAKEIAKLHKVQQNFLAARMALETAFQRHSDLVQYDDIDMLLDIILISKNYADSLSVITAYAGIKFVPPDDFPSEEKFSSLPVLEQVAKAVSCDIPADLPMILRSKLVVCLIMCEAFKLVEPIVAGLMLKPTKLAGEHYIAAADAYLQSGNGKAALPLLRSLLQCPKHKQAADVWRLYAEALVATEESHESAVNAYYRVVELAPCNATVRLTLANMLLKQELLDPALGVLTQNEPPYDCQVLYQKCELLYEHELHDDFINSVSLLLGKHCVNIRAKDEAEVLINNKKASNKTDALRELRRSKGEPVDDDIANKYTGEDVPLIDQWSLFVRACSLLYTQKRFAELERLTYSALGSREFRKDHMRDVEFFCLQASMANCNSFFAFNLTRDIVVRHLDCPRVWNLLDKVIIRADDFRHNRFLLRLIQKYSDNHALSMLNGHNCLTAGTYKYSLVEYMKVFKGNPSDPLASLMLGLTYIHMACQKFSADKNTLVTQAWVFLNSYRELKGDSQETFFNIGRAMHQLNLLHQAIYYYELALNCPKPITQPGEMNIDTTEEIAMNLAALYRKGNPKLSRYYIRKYIRK